MDFEKESFEDDNELSQLEDDEELGGETQEMVETEEEELAIVGEEPEEEAPALRPAPAARPAPAKAAKKKAAPKKKPKRNPKRKPRRNRPKRQPKKRRGAKRFPREKHIFQRAGSSPGSFFCGNRHFKLRILLTYSSIPN